MKIQVEMLAFMDNGVFREVEIPDVEIPNQNALLDQVFYYGQNDFQPRPFPSVSVGDVVYLEDKKFLIKGSGFKELSEEDYEGFCQLPQRDRTFFAMTA